MNIVVHSYSINERKKKYIKAKAEKYIKLLRFSNKMEGQKLTIKILKKSYMLNTKTEDAVFLFNLSDRKNSALNTEHTIIINNDIANNRPRLLRALIHELVHLRQYLSRKLVYVKRKCDTKTTAVWSKKIIGYVEFISYWKQPWEIEALRIEKKYWDEKKL